jgi:hypothetical protein
MPLTLASNAITFTDNTALSSGVIGTAQLSAGAVTASKIASNTIRDLMPTGSILQSVTTSINTFQTINATYSWSDTLPTTSGGAEVVGLSATITPSSVNNKILVRAIILGSSNSSVIDYYMYAIFRDANTNAIAAAGEYGASYTNQIYIEYLDTPGTLSPVTYKIRGGTNAGNALHVNGAGNPGTRRLGGAAWSTITVQEIKG